jgi:hypothetical protein
MNKKRFTFLAALFIAVSIFGQSPEKISYQAVVRDATNTTVANQVVGMRISVLQTTANGTAVYVETQTPTTNANGLLSIYIGAGTVGSGVFSVIDWSSGPYFIKIEIDLSGNNTNYTITGTTQLVSVPFALYAKTSGSSATNASNIAALEARIVALEPQPASIGDLRAGGVVFWVDGNGGGLVCALQDYPNSVEWGCDTDLPNVPNATYGIPYGPGAEIGDGMSNTNEILIDCPTAPAALAAHSLGPEWFLPSINELNQMYIHKITLEAVAGFSAFSNGYWSSTEYDNSSAWRQNFVHGNQANPSKGNPINVRAVRAF